MLAGTPPIRLVTRSFGATVASAMPLTVQLVGDSPKSSVAKEMVNDHAPGLELMPNCRIVAIPVLPEPKCDIGTPIFSGRAPVLAMA